MKRFALIGAAGYIAPRHMQAIKETGNELVAAVDKSDSVGIIDNYFPDAAFFTEFERFDRHLEKLKRKGEKVDYVVVCSPNYLHDAHIRFGLRYGAYVICEKPLVLNPWNVDALKEIEIETGKKIYSILQLRLHAAIIELKKRVESGPPDKVYEVELTYITSRGNWYYASWKGNEEKSGGIATNIGVHFFDMLGWVFGELKENVVHIHTHDRASGYQEYNQARVKWFLSIIRNTLPEEIKAQGKRTYRSMAIDRKEMEFSGGFEDLHIKSYEEILTGSGYGIGDSTKAIVAIYDIRHATPIGIESDCHPLAHLPLTPHPFKR